MLSISPKLSFKAGEIDPAWPVIKLMTILGVAQLQGDLRAVRRHQPASFDNRQVADGTEPAFLWRFTRRDILTPCRSKGEKE